MNQATTTWSVVNDDKLAPIAAAFVLIFFYLEKAKKAQSPR